MYQSRLVQIYSDTQLLYTLYIAAAFGLLLVCVALIFSVVFLGVDEARKRFIRSLSTCIFQQGYFRRAEALKGILTNSQDGRAPGTYKDVVRDYVRCHKLHSNLDAFFNAVTIGHHHSEYIYMYCRALYIHVQCSLLPTLPELLNVHV